MTAPSQKAPKSLNCSLLLVEWSPIWYVFAQILLFLHVTPEVLHLLSQRRKHFDLLRQQSFKLLCVTCNARCEKLVHLVIADLNSCTVQRVFLIFQQSICTHLLRRNQLLPSYSGVRCHFQASSAFAVKRNKFCSFLLRPHNQGSGFLQHKLFPVMYLEKLTSTTAL